jgi:nucleotide-binding universal stress UspA family protein
MQFWNEVMPSDEASSCLLAHRQYPSSFAAQDGCGKASRRDAMTRRFLVPIDGSAPAQRGLEEALRLARPLDASLVLLHVVEIYPMMMEMASATTWDAVTTDLRRYGEEVLERARLDALAQKVAVEAHLEEAGAARVCDVITDHASAHHCDLIVMGTHGRRGLEHALLGSDAERVVRQSKVPVLLVPSSGS